MNLHQWQPPSGIHQREWVLLGSIEEVGWIPHSTHPPANWLESESEINLVICVGLEPELVEFGAGSAIFFTLGLEAHLM